ncbi:CAF17-like 4Fe-4S cluster assembly/insertion protein YgfZ [Rubripirellula reticaptiva]|nr:aminomethyltransferase [Rubripirellula reticaptiva]
MKTSSIYRISPLSIVDTTGADSAAIVHNITTNEVKKLVVGEGRETFVTDVRGKTIGHGFLYRLEDRFRLIGAGGQSDRIVAHIDRYTIREDAVPTIRDADFVALVLRPGVADELGIKLDSCDTNAITTDAAVIGDVTIGNIRVQRYRTRWLGEGTDVILVAPDDIDQLEQWLASKAIDIGDEAALHAARTAAGFPWYGIDLTDANLPQEADRDDLAISFTKGCYLGQETVARLDALGQVQKKLVRWSICGATPEKDATLVANEKTVGRLTSIAVLTTNRDSGSNSAPPMDAIAIGFARRSHFDAAATAKGTTAEGKDFNATVLDANVLRE